MSKLKRLEEPGAGYFVTTITRGRKPIFQDPEAARLFLTILRDYKPTPCFKVYGYVVMPDHVHLFIHPEGSAGLSEIMKRIKGKFARWYNKKVNQVGTVWQHSFHSEGVKSEKAFWKKINYILDNPVRRKLATFASDFPFSSAKAYLEYIDDGITDRYPG